MSFNVKKGTNISHWLSQSKTRGEQRKQSFTFDHVKQIADLGFDHIRIPVDEEQLWNEDNERELEAFELLDNALDWCEKEGLKAIVDLHILRSHYFNQKTEPALYTDPEEPKHFADLWADLSSFMINRSNDKVAYELMNEPVASDPEDWNRVYEFALSAVRAKEPDRTVILGANRWQEPEMFEFLKIPEDDNLILSLHFYYPHIVSHYRAGWMGFDRLGCKVRYPGISLEKSDWEKISDPELKEATKAYCSNYDKEVMRQKLEWPLRVKKETGYSLYCGEFGCLNTVSKQIRHAWYSDIVSLFKEYDIAYANWDYKSGGFGLLNADKTVNKALVDIVV